MATYTGAGGDGVGVATDTDYTRTGFSVATATTATTDNPTALGGRVVGEADAFEEQELAGLSKWATPAPTQVIDGFTDAGQVARDSAWQPAEREGLEVDEVRTGVLIPLQYFRSVSGRVLDEEGNPIEDALYLGAAGRFPTLGLVEDGTYQIYLLRVAYDDFVLLADAPGPSPYDFVRYELEEANPKIGTTATEVDLKFDTTTPKPTQMGSDVMMGFRL